VFTKARLSQMHPLYNLTRYFSRIYCNIIFPSSVFPSGLPTKILYAYFLSPMHAMCSAHTILLNLIALIIFGKAYLDTLRVTCK